MMAHWPHYNRDQLIDDVVTLLAEKGVIADPTPERTGGIARGSQHRPRPEPAADEDLIDRPEDVPNTSEQLPEHPQQPFGLGPVLFA